MFRSARGLILIAVSLLFLASAPVNAQVDGATLRGAIASSTGAAVPNARISLKNTATGQTTNLQTDQSGKYSAGDLQPGDYEVSVAAEGFAAKTTKVTLSTGAEQTLDLQLETPAPAAAPPSLEDLGIPAAQSQGSALEQARLDRRSRMLKTHQRLGLITAIPFAATLIASGSAGGRSSSTGRAVHAGLGAVTAGMYFTTASFAIRAPRIPGSQSYGQIRLHKALAWIHGPGMVLTPILGALAYAQRDRGERVHGIASAHGAVAATTAVAYAAALLSVSIKF